MWVKVPFGKRDGNRHTAWAEMHCGPLGDHPGQSCLTGGYHMIFCRELADSEWRAFQDVCDQAWNGKDGWDAEKIAQLIEEVTGGVKVVGFEA